MSVRKTCGGPGARMVGLSLLVMLVIGATPVHAQSSDIQGLLSRLNVTSQDGKQIVEVDLRTILQLTMERSISLQSSRLQREIARSNLIAARERNHPTLTNEMEIESGVSRFSSTFFSGESYTLSSGFEKTTSSGITYGLTYEEIRLRSRSLSIDTDNDTFTLGSFDDWISASSVTGTVSIPIFQDWGSDINDIPVRLGELGVRRTNLSVRDQELRVLSDIAKSYWRLVGLQQGLQVRLNAVQLSEQLLKDNQARLRAGVLSPSDVQASETQLALERVNRLEIELEIVVIQDRVRAALNLAELQGYGFNATDTPTVGETSFDMQDLLKKVFRNQPDLGILRTQLEYSHYNLSQARNEDLTDLDLELSYVLNGFSSESFGGTSKFSESDLQGYRATLTWSLPLFDQTTPETIRRRQIEQKQLELRIRDLESVLTVNLQTILRSLALAAEEARAARVAMDLAKAQLNNGVDRFRLGRSTSFEVAELQQDSRQAEEREILTRIKYETALIDLLILTGGIYSRYGLNQSGRSDYDTQADNSRE